MSLTFFASESLEIQPEVTSEQEGDTFPEHNFENIIKVIFRQKIQYGFCVFRFP